MSVVHLLFTRGRGLGLAIAVACTTGGLALIAAFVLGIPLRDPDGFLGPSYIRLPLILSLFILADIVPRALYLARSCGLRSAVPAVIAHRWPKERMAIVLVALASFYVTYVGYRNLKSFIPLVRTQSEDLALMATDDMLTFGYHPGDLLHEVLGTGVSAHVLSFVYMAFLMFVPISLAAALVWSRNMTLGLWYTTALCLNWALGTASYYLIPASGPFAEFRWRFYDLPDTGVSALQDGLLRSRANVLADPYATQSVSSIAAFASLHISIVFSAALIVHLARFPRVVRWTMWVFLVLTAIATIYFGWHYIVDDIAGLAIGGVSVWLAWLATRRASFSLSRAAAPVPAEELVTG